MLVVGNGGQRLNFCSIHLQIRKHQMLQNGQKGLTQTLKRNPILSSTKLCKYGHEIFQLLHFLSQFWSTKADDPTVSFFKDTMNENSTSSTDSVLLLPHKHLSTFH